MMPISEELFARAKAHIPGGVNSPVRAFGSVGMTPPFIARGAGSRLWDEDGSREEPLAVLQMRWDGSRFLSQSGFFLLEQQGEGAWVLEPDASPMEFSGNYRQGEESFSYHVLLRPWGQEWSGEQRLPFRYNDWYLPLIGSGEAMPERIG